MTSDSRRHRCGSETPLSSSGRIVHFKGLDIIYIINLDVVDLYEYIFRRRI